MLLFEGDIPENEYGEIDNIAKRLEFTSAYSTMESEICNTFVSEVYDKRKLILTPIIINRIFRHI